MQSFRVGSRGRRASIAGALVVLIGLMAGTSMPVAASGNTWTATASMIVARYDQSATTLLDGRVLVAGGGQGAEIYNSSTATWSLTGPMNAARRDQAAARLTDGRVLVAGGDATGKSAEIYNPATNTWTLTSSLNIAREHPVGVALSDGRVLVVGGQDPSTGMTLASGELYTTRARAHGP
jgi:hypothetical protein